MDKEDQAIRLTAYHLEALEYHKDKLLQEVKPLIWEGEKNGLPKESVRKINHLLNEFLEQLTFRKNKSFEYIAKINEEEIARGIDKRSKENESLFRVFRNKQ